MAGQERARAADAESAATEAMRLDIANGMPQLVWTCSRDGACDFLNKRWLDYTGVPMEQQLHYGWLELVHPEDRVPLMAAWKASLERAAELRVEHRLRRHDGVFRWFDARAVPAFDTNGEVLQWFGASTDIQEQYELRQRLRQQTDRLQSIIASVPGLIYSFRMRPDGTSSVPFASPAILDLCGVTARDVADDATPIVARIHKADRASALDAAMTSAAGMTLWHFAFRYNHPAKGERWMEGHSQPLREPDGSILWQGVMLDVTERRREQVALRESERRLTVQNAISWALAQATSLAGGCSEAIRMVCETEDWDGGVVWQMDSNNETLRCAATWVRPGIPALEVFARLTRDTTYARGSGGPGRVWESRAPLSILDVSKDASLTRAQAALAAGLHGALFVPIADGEAVSGVLELFVRRKLTEASLPLQLLGAISGQVHNFMVRVRAEHALRQSEGRLTSVIENLTEGLVTADLDQHLTHWNSTALAMHGMGSPEIANKILPDFLKLFEFTTLAGDPVPFEQWPIPRITRGEVLRGWELRLRRLDLDWHKVFRYGGSLVRQSDGSELVVLGISDVTERVETAIELRRLNAELERRVSLRTSELENANRELEAFSYSVSHDLRAPLRAMIGYSQMLLEDYASLLPSEALRLTKTISDSGLRMGDLIDDLLALSRLGRKELKLREVDMRELAQIVLDESHFEGRERAELVLHPLPACRGDVQLLRQVWVNLLSNAFKYARARDPIRIEIGSERSATGAPIYFVRDNGAGFDMRYAHKLFGVFQRLHGAEEFEGTGVGLAIVQRIVERHGGRVWGEGTVNAGAKFAFTVPSPDQHAERGPSAIVHPTHAGDANP